ncbi:NAD(P)-binding protein [Punctularia strigosozonata HHB-11173 SS5]|uniref:NAD(P)-binding protein n=1 Tax=Punctularia strigosozonata (strain HHB-11173) TaxID=741275 RepID=UPI000441692A|nr:NAD(P)-binding protein [Punctularia strigosozonata HHB-11173 SS5]EIN06632.1 NAD(P)-binding protein [Punctularia strigosozonata HHB-11173 SS5]
MSVNKVAVAGATGNIGQAITEQLVAAKFDVIVLSRSENPSKVPAGVAVRHVDYDSVESLTVALQGVDAVVSAVAFAGILGQTKLVDAAVAAGVKRFLPSEYGSDLRHPAARALSVFAPKAKVEDYLETVSAEHPGLTYTFVSSGPFLDWTLRAGILLGDVKARKAEVYDGGRLPFSATTLAGVGRGVAAVLRHLEETKNRTVALHEAVVSQGQILDIAKELTPAEEWTVTESQSADLKARADAKLAKGVFDMEVAISLIKWSTFSEGFGDVHLKGVDNDMLGIRLLSDEELKAIVASAL